MHCAWLRSTFLRVSKFPQIKEGGPDFWGKRILQKVSIISSPVLYFNFRKFNYPNFFSLIRFQCILYDSVVHFWESWNFYKLKSGDLVSWGNWFCRKSQLFGPPLLYLNFKSFMDPNSSSFMISQCILHDGGILFSESWKFYKLKSWGLISVGNQFGRESELFGRPFCISILKVLWTHILHHSLDLNAFCMIE